ncbi:MAG TPA: hypothetical protein VGI66_03420 [Streptosporangiaceae bacterium]|jgi:hypothetical protein
MTTRSDNPPGTDTHADDCARRLPYTNPLHRSLDREHCARCSWLWSLLDQAAERRQAEMEAVKAFVLSQLDSLPHRARGFSASDIYSQMMALRDYGGVAASLSYASRDKLNASLRHLLEDKIIADSYVQGTRRYHMRGR